MPFYTAEEDSQRGRIRDLETSEFIDFFYIPEQISDDVSAEWNDIGPIIGRSSPIHAYGSTGARALNLELTFFAEVDARTEVFDKIQWIQSLKYPDYRGKFMKPPHRISLIIGSFIALDGILKSADVTWKAPFDSDSKFPMLATTTVTIEEDVDTPYGFDRVRKSIRLGYGDPKNAGKTGL